MCVEKGSGPESAQAALQDPRGWEREGSCRSLDVLRESLRSAHSVDESMQGVCGSSRWPWLGWGGFQWPQVPACHGLPRRTLVLWPQASTALRPGPTRGKEEDRGTG